ncbi:MAG: erythromycin esterase family protein [Brumimicrobium sp.]|nr:erythromycin esterase family protein [Brumimicrobium sp.]
MSTKQKFNVHFYANKKKVKEGKVQLYVRIVVNQRRAEFATSHFIEVKYWNEKQRKVKTSHQQSHLINAYIDKTVYEINQIIFEESAKGTKLSSKYIKEKYLGVGDTASTHKSIMDAFDYHNTKMEEQVKIGKVVKKTHTRYRITKNKVEAFMQHQYNLDDMPLPDLRLRFVTEFKQELRRSWYHLWSKSEQTQELLNYLEKNQSLKFVGIENQAGNEYWLSFPYILKELMGKEVYQGIEFAAFKENLTSFYNIYFLGNNEYNEDFELVDLREELNILYRNSSLINNEHKKYLLHGIRNIQGFISQLELNFGTYEQQNQSISMRDSLMYENLKFHLNRNPDEKIIIWTANFHAAKNLDQAEYKEGDDFYQTMKTLGHRIYEDYEKDLFSLAFISSQGETASIYDAEADPIVLDDSCWENDIERNLNFDYAFIDFALLKEKYGDNTAFNSCLLGYKSKYGNWLSIFDGVFYIKNMERSLPLNEKYK